MLTHWSVCQAGLNNEKMEVENLVGQSNKIFDLQFFHHLNQPGPLTNRLKYF